MNTGSERFAHITHQTSLSDLMSRTGVSHSRGRIHDVSSCPEMSGLNVGCAAGCLLSIAWPQAEGALNASSVSELCYWEG